MTDKRILNQEETAEYVGRSVSSLKRLMIADQTFPRPLPTEHEYRKGDGTSSRKKARPKFDRVAVDRWVDAQSAAAAETTANGIRKAEQILAATRPRRAS